MFKLISAVNVIPKSLFITGVKTEMHLGLIGIGGFGRVFHGEYEGRKVALKVVDRGRNDVSPLPFSLSPILIVSSGFVQKRPLPRSLSMAIPRSPFHPPPPRNI